MIPLPMFAHQRHHLPGSLAFTWIWTQHRLSVEDVAEAPHWPALTAQPTRRRRLHCFSSLGESLSACLKCLHFHCCARVCLIETLGAPIPVCVGRRLKDCFSAAEPRPTCHNFRPKSEDAMKLSQLAHRHRPRWGARSWVMPMRCRCAFDRIFWSGLSGMARRRLADCFNAAEPRTRPVTSYQPLSHTRRCNTAALAA
jgi:hypothetical protein